MPKCVAYLLPGVLPEADFLRVAPSSQACFIAFAQGHGNLQVIALVIIEGLTVLVYIVFRPESTKKGDWFGVILGLLRFIGTGLLLVFTSYFQPGGITQTIIAVRFLPQST